MGRKNSRNKRACFMRNCFSGYMQSDEKNASCADRFWFILWSRRATENKKIPATAGILDHLKIR